MLPTFVTPLALLPPPYTSRADSFTHFASPASPALPIASPRYTHSYVLRSWIAGPPFARPDRQESLFVVYLGRAGLATLGESAAGESPRTLVSRGSILCLQQPPRRLVVFLSYGESPAGPVPGSVANGDHAYELPAPRSFGPVPSVDYRVALLHFILEVSPCIFY